MDGLKLLSHLPSESIPVAFLDPQYKGVWKTHNIHDVWRKRKETMEHPHQKLQKLQSEHIAVVLNEGYYVI